MMNIVRYIALEVPERLEKKTIGAWFQCVRDNEPEGIIITLQNPESLSNTVSLVERRTETGFAYVIPLARDLDEGEAKAIVDKFCETHSSLDFEIKITSSTSDDEGKDEITIDHDAYDGLCAAWAKRQHEEWLNDRTGQGWRYGAIFSVKDKTHPLLRPWDDLPEQYRKINVDDPQKLVDLLGEQGFMVVSKAEVDALFKLMRKAL